MSVSESIECLFDNGISGLTIGKPPKGPDSPEWFIKADQGITTGPRGNQMICGHQVDGETIGDCLNRMCFQV